MKKFILAAVAATLVATPALAAPQNHRGQQTHTTVKQKPDGRVVVKQKTIKPRVTQRVTYRTPQTQYRQWGKGQRFDSRYARNYRQIDHRQFRGRLNAPPRGYRYVQSGNDVVMVSIASGIIGAVFASLIR